MAEETTNIPAADTPWTAGLDEETRGWVATKGWDKLDAATATANAVRSYREAEKKFGIPPDQLVRLPRADAPVEELKSFWGRLGVPDKPEGYDLSGIKHKDGSDLDEGFANSLRQLAAESNVPAPAVQRLAAALAAMADEAEAASTSEATRQIDTAKANLATAWGGEGSVNYDMNLAVARRGAANIGVTAEQITALEGTIGYPAAMEAFRKLGVAMGEAKTFLGSAGPGNDGKMAMTVEEAVSKREQLMADKAWGSRWAAGGVQEGNDMNDLLNIIVRSGRRV